MHMYIYIYKLHICIIILLFFVQLCSFLYSNSELRSTLAFLEENGEPSMAAGSTGGTDDRPKANRKGGGQKKTKTVETRIKAALRVATDKLTESKGTGFEIYNCLHGIGFGVYNYGIRVLWGLGVTYKPCKPIFK